MTSVLQIRFSEYPPSILECQMWSVSSNLIIEKLVKSEMPSTQGIGPVFLGLPNMKQIKVILK